MIKYAVLIVVAMNLLCACGLKGDQGGQGNTGPAGAQGPAGDDGIDGTSPSLVQFCHGTTHYPDTFCEVGFCFNGQLYATYSANGGFSSAIPAGTYSSNGINCSCTFTVVSSCIIQ